MLKKHNKMLMVLVLITFMFSIIGTAGAASFSDVQSYWFGETTAQHEAIYKLNALGIVSGYPDGTFRPDATITRAEFAKIAVYTAGLQDVANGMAGVSSTFNDVESSLWYNGWVNVAAAQGFVKGFPDGTFKPEAQITQQEVITVFLRILGYNDNLYGDWPADYIAKAVSLEILDDITFTANQAASRGDVAVMGSETLEQNIVEYEASDNIFEEDKKDGDVYSLLDDNFDGKFYEDAFVLYADRGNDEITYSVFLTDFNSDGKYALSSPRAVKLADKGEYYLANALGSEIEPENKFIDYIVNDDDEIIYLTIKNHGIIRTNEIELSSNGTKLEATGDYIAKLFKKTAVSGEAAALDKKYDFAKNAFVYPFTDLPGFGYDAAGRQKSLDMLYAMCEGANNVYLPMFTTQGSPFYNFEDKIGRIDIEINDDGDVVLVRLNAYPRPAIVDYVNYEKETISFKEPAFSSKDVGFNSKVSNLKDKDYYIKYNGLPGTLEDINEDDVLWILDGVNHKGYRGCDCYLIVVSDDMPGARLTGTLEEVKTRGDNTLKEVIVEGMTFKALPSLSLPMYSTDNGDDFKILKDAEDICGGDNDLLGEKVTLVFNAFGYVAYIISDVDGSDSGRIYGPIIKEIKNTTMGGEVVDMIKIMNRDEDEVSYAIDDDTTLNNKEDDDFPRDIIDMLNEGQLISFTLKSDGTIDNIKTTDIDSATGISTVDTDLNTIKIGSKWYTGSDAVVFNVIYKNGKVEDADVLKWGDLEDHLDNNGTLDMTYYLDDNELQYVCLQGASLAADSHYAIFKSAGKDSTDPFVKVAIDGEFKKVYLNGDSSYSKAKVYKKGNVIEFEWDGSDIKIVGKAAPELDKLTEVSDVEIDNNIIEIEIDPVNKTKKAFLVDEDTAVFDCSDTDNLEVIDLDSIARGDEIYFIYKDGDDNEALDVIVISDKNEFEKQIGGEMDRGTGTSSR